MFNADDLVELQQLRALQASGALRSVRGSLSLREMTEAVGDGTEPGLSPSTILRWEKGERIPHGESAIRYGRLIKRLLNK